MILFEEGATQAQRDEAHGILEVLTTAYPGYPWAVRVYDGGFFIRHLGFPSQFGMNCKYRSAGMSWTTMKREIILMAGEFLERAALKRGRNVYEEDIGRVEGVPEQFQPPSEKPPLLADAIVVAPAEQRTDVRPQAKELLQ